MERKYTPEELVNRVFSGAGKYNSSWEAIHDDKFKDLIKQMVEQTPKDYYNDKPHDKGFLYDTYKNMLDETGKDYLNRRDFYSLFGEDDDKEGWRRLRVHPSDVGIKSMENYDNLLDMDTNKLAEKIGLELAPNMEPSKFKEYTEDLADLIINRREELRNQKGQSDKSIDAIKDNSTSSSAKGHLEEDYPPETKITKEDEERFGKDALKGLGAIDTNDNGKIEVDEMADFQKSLDDYAAKNKKGRDDIPVTTRR